MVGPEAFSFDRGEDQRLGALGQVVVDRSQRLLQVQVGVVDREVDRRSPRRGPLRPWSRSGTTRGPGSWSRGRPSRAASNPPAAPSGPACAPAFRLLQGWHDSRLGLLRPPAPQWVRQPEPAVGSAAGAVGRLGGRGLSRRGGRRSSLRGTAGQCERQHHQDGQQVPYERLFRECFMGYSFSPSDVNRTWVDTVDFVANGDATFRSPPSRAPPRWSLRCLAGSARDDHAG